MKNFTEYVEKVQSRLQFVENLQKNKHVTISYDSLEKSTTTDSEMLYFTLEDGSEHSGMFVFGSQFYIDDLNEQEFKHKLSLDSLNFKILRAHKRLSKKSKQVKISDILQEIQDKKKDSSELHIILRRILTLAYYLNWDMKRDTQDIEGDSFITIPDRYLLKLKQRFSFEMMCGVYEDEEVFLFLNTRGKLNMVFKDKDEFSRRDIEKIVPKLMSTIFGCEECHFS